MQFNTDHRFARNSPLRFMTFLYNLAPSRNTNKPDVVMQARLVRRGQVIRTIPMLRMSFDAPDLARVPFGGEIPLNSIPAGNYVLEITATDETTRMSASQAAKITVE